MTVKEHKSAADRLAFATLYNTLTMKRDGGLARAITYRQIGAGVRPC